MSKSIKKLLENRLFIQVLPIIFLVVMSIFFAVTTQGRFIQTNSLKIILEQSLIVGTVSTGATFIFATGNVNLAMGATTVLTATLAGMVFNRTESVPIMILAAIALGVILMTISVLLSTIFHVRVMFVTIVMMTLLTALQQTILGGSTVSVAYAVTNGLRNAGFMYISFGIFFVICIVLFHMTAIGRSLRMLGTNEVCATQTGLEKPRLLTTAFIIAGVGCGIGSILAIVRAGSIGQNTLTSLNMDCMLALVLGGMSIFGGSKSFVYSGIVGAITVCALNQGMTMLNIDTNIVQGVRGILFLILVCMGQQRPKGLPAPEG